jgi:hypothetical protein
MVVAVPPLQNKSAASNQITKEAIFATKNLHLIFCVLHVWLASRAHSMPPKVMCCLWAVSTATSAPCSGRTTQPRCTFVVSMSHSGAFWSSISLQVISTRNWQAIEQLKRACCGTANPSSQPLRHPTSAPMDALHCIAFCSASTSTFIISRAEHGSMPFTCNEPTTPQVVEVRRPPVGLCVAPRGRAVTKLIGQKPSATQPGH